MWALQGAVRKLCKFVCQAWLVHFYTAPSARVLYNPLARLNDSPPPNSIHFGRMRTSPPSCFMNWGKPADGGRGGASTSSRSGQRLLAACRLQEGGGGSGGKAWARAVEMVELQADLILHWSSRAYISGDSEGTPGNESCPPLDTMATNHQLSLLSPTLAFTFFVCIFV